MQKETRSPDDLRGVVQAYYDALDRDDLEAALGLFSGDALYRRPGYETIVGMERLRTYYQGDRKLAAGRHLVRDVLVESQRAAAHGMYEGELRDGGRMTMGFGAFFVFDSLGRITEHTTYFFVPAV